MVRYPSDEAGVGVTREELAERFPRLLHVAAGGSWSMIERHGLPSASGLLDPFGVSGGTRSEIEARREGVGAAIVRDRHAMNDPKLHGAPCGGTPPGEWYKALGSKAFSGQPGSGSSAC